MRKYTLITFLFLFIFCFLPIQVFAEDEDIEEEIGNNVRLGSVSVSVKSISHYKEKVGLFLQHLDKQYEGVPQNYYAVELFVLNTSRDNYEYSPYQFSIIDSEENEYQWCISTKEPKFEGKILKPGMAGRGFLVFAVPKTVNPTHVVFDPGYVYDGRVKFMVKDISPAK
jgi:hypothetical protein